MIMAPASAVPRRPAAPRDTLGLVSVVERLRGLEKEHGARFAPCELLVRMSQERASFRVSSRASRPWQPGPSSAQRLAVLSGGASRGSAART